MTVTELVPFAQGSASSMAQVGNVTTATVDPLVTVSGGSVSDASDGTYVEIGAWYDEPIARSHVEILTADFATSGVPTAMGVQIRASTPDATLASPPEGTRLLWVVFTAISDGTYLGSQSYNGDAFGPFAFCAQSGPATAETFWGDPLDRANPTDPGNWCEVKPAADGGGEMSGAFEALTGSGIRVSVFIQHAGSSTPPTSRIPWMNVHELRLVVAGEFGAPIEEVWFASPIRQRQRADGLGLSSASRTSQLRTKQGSLRGGPNGVD